MFYLIILILLTMLSPVWLNRIFKRSVSGKEKIFSELNEEYRKLSQENEQIKQGNLDIGRKTEETTALYDLAKEICRSLDEDKIFSLFKENAGRYIRVKDYRLLKPDTDVSDYKDFEMLPLLINKNTVGYLAASGLANEEREKFHILGQQFLLGFGRALLYKKVQELMITDSLTNVYTRRYFLEKLDEEIARSKKFKLGFSFLMVDIDHFKSFNDNYGHLVGDAILKEVTKTIKESIRQIDFMGRYGGEELSVVLTETNKEESLLIAERIREAVETRLIAAYDENLKVTISIGVSLFPAVATDRLTIIDKADQALYLAKQSGRNKVLTYS